MARKSTLVNLFPSRPSSLTLPPPPQPWFRLSASATPSTWSSPIPSTLPPPHRPIPPTDLFRPLPLLSSPSRTSWARSPPIASSDRPSTAPSTSSETLPSSERQPTRRASSTDPLARAGTSFRARWASSPSGPPGAPTGLRRACLRLGSGSWVSSCRGIGAKEEEVLTPLGTCAGHECTLGIRVA